MFQACNVSAGEHTVLRQQLCTVPLHATALALTKKPTSQYMNCTMHQHDVSVHLLCPRYCERKLPVSSAEATAFTSKLSGQAGWCMYTWYGCCACEAAAVQNCKPADHHQYGRVCSPGAYMTVEIEAPAQREGRLKRQLADTDKKAVQRRQ